MLTPTAPPADAPDGLRAVELLSGLDSARLDHLAQEVEWFELTGGQVLFRQGDQPDGVYFVVAGRVRVSATEDDGQERAITELGRGETLGELGLLVASPRSATVTALRRSVLARLSTALFEELLQSDPVVMLRLTQTVARRMLSAQSRDRAATSLTTIAVASLVGDAERGRFVDGLCRALAAHRSVERWDETILAGAALRNAIDKAEATGTLVVADVGRAMSPEAAAFLQESDRVLVVANGQAAPPQRPRDPDQAVFDAVQGESGTELVLIQQRGAERPRGTARWLEHHAFEAHHHVRDGDRSDLARVARHLLGTSVCLVLGGGGARSFAHIGVYRAVLEAGIPIDRVGGSSIGAVIAAQIAAGMTPEHMLEMNDVEWRSARINRRFALPVVSLLSVRTAVPMFDRMYGDSMLEDLWVPCFTTTVDLNSCRLVAHRRGGVARWVRASASPPGIWPPVVADDGGLHVDGGVLDNLPVQLMRRGGPGQIITVNVSPHQPMVAPVEGAEPLGSFRLLRSLLAAKGKVASPNIVKILYRTVVVTSLEAQAKGKALSDVYIEPDVSNVGLADYDLIRDIVNAGYDAARREIERGKGVRLALRVRA